MKRVTAIFLSTFVTVLLVITVLAAGQPRAQTITSPTTAVGAPTSASNAVQPSAASDAFASPQFETEHQEHEDGEHDSRGTARFSLRDD